MACIVVKSKVQRLAALLSSQRKSLEAELKNEEGYLWFLEQGLNILTEADEVSKLRRDKWPPKTRASARGSLRNVRLPADCASTLSSERTSGWPYIVEQKLNVGNFSDRYLRSSRFESESSNKLNTSEGSTYLTSRLALSSQLAESNLNFIFYENYTSPYNSQNSISPRDQTTLSPRDSFANKLESPHRLKQEKSPQSEICGSPVNRIQYHSPDIRYGNFSKMVSQMTSPKDIKSQDYLDSLAVRLGHDPSTDRATYCHVRTPPVANYFARKCSLNVAYQSTANKSTCARDIVSQSLVWSKPMPTCEEISGHRRQERLLEVA